MVKKLASSQFSAMRKANIGVAPEHRDASLLKTEI